MDEDSLALHKIVARGDLDALIKKTKRESKRLGSSHKRPVVSESDRLSSHFSRRIKKILHQEGDTNLQVLNAQQQTILHVAVLESRFEIILYLLEKLFMSPDPKDQAGNTALHYLVRSKEYDHQLYDRALGQLIKQSSDINSKNAKGETPLIVASAHGNERAVVALLEAHAQTDIQTNNLKETAMHLAVRGGYRRIVGLLFNHKADITLIAASGTPRELAQKFGQIAIAEDLSYYEQKLPQIKRAEMERQKSQVIRSGEKTLMIPDSNKLKKQIQNQLDFLRSSSAVPVPSHISPRSPREDIPTASSIFLNPPTQPQKENKDLLSPYPTNTGQLHQSNQTTSNIVKEVKLPPSTSDTGLPTSAKADGSKLGTLLPTVPAKPGVYNISKTATTIKRPVGTPPVAVVHKVAQTKHEMESQHNADTHALANKPLPPPPVKSTPQTAKKQTIPQFETIKPAPPDDQVWYSGVRSEDSENEVNFNGYKLELTEQIMCVNSDPRLQHLFSEWKAVLNIPNSPPKLFNVQRINLHEYEVLGDMEPMLRDEILMIAQLNHAHLNSYLGLTISTSNTVNFISEYQAETLASLLKREAMASAPVAFMTALLKQLLSALHFLHSNKIIHRALDVL
eukprot:TRINITY_DN2637_c0_g1_i2.p1 TRINITY_DN2637_c0_g1~~TRINITY_DN2637_c0_g1_i2.p1  ORF type:complete len:624 (-),score=116.70 TRINITY_DN2637_c0_g1_i2:929-2800(-)